MHANTGPRFHLSRKSWLLFFLVLLLGVLSLWGCGQRTQEALPPGTVTTVPVSAAGTAPVEAPPAVKPPESSDAATLREEAKKAHEQSDKWEKIANDLDKQAKMAAQEELQHKLYLTAGLFLVAALVLGALGIYLRTVHLLYGAAGAIGGAALCWVGGALVPYLMAIAIGVVVLIVIAVIVMLFNRQKALVQVTDAVEAIKPQVANYKSIFRERIDSGVDKLLNKIRGK